MRWSRGRIGYPPITRPLDREPQPVIERARIWDGSILLCTTTENQERKDTDTRATSYRRTCPFSAVADSHHHGPSRLPRPSPLKNAEATDPLVTDFKVRILGQPRLQGLLLIRPLGVIQDDDAV